MTIEDMTDATDVACATIDAAIERIAVLEQERDAWEQTALRHHRNECFYYDLITKIGDYFGAAAYTSDDGSLQDTVLTLRVPELVRNTCLRARTLFSLCAECRGRGVIFKTGREHPVDGEDIECVACDGSGTVMRAP